jgi:hypothetical protein
MGKIWSLRHWIHVFKRVYRLIRSPQVPLLAKVLFIVPTILYWVMPDVLPFMPLDDIGVTMLLAQLFSTILEKKYPTP